MDEESEVEEVPDSEEIVEEIQTHQTEVPPTEGAFGKYLREHRLLNSLLISLGTIVGIIGFMLAWTIVVPVGEEGGSDFGDAGAPAQQQQQEKQKVVKLMQRQKKAQQRVSKLLKRLLYPISHCRTSTNLMLRILLQLLKLLPDHVPNFNDE